MEYSVYILYSKKCDKYYVGHTQGLLVRIDEHNYGKGGKFSTGCLPWELRYHEKFNTRTEAMKREREIKSKKSRKYIERLVEQKG